MTGNYRREIDNEANPFGFTGHEMDDESGLVYMKARFYDPEVGLFLSNDPVEGDPSNPPSLHRYLYAFQNPTVYVDPDGRVAVGKQAADAAGATSDAIEQLVGAVAGSEWAQDGFGKEVAKAIAAGAGQFAGSLELTESVIRTANTLFNLYLAGDFLIKRKKFRYSEELTDQAIAELVDDFVSVLNFSVRAHQLVQYVFEHPDAAAAKALGMGIQPLADAWHALEALDRGDPEAIFKLSKGIYTTSAGVVGARLGAGRIEFPNLRGLFDEVGPGRGGAGTGKGVRDTKSGTGRDYERDAQDAIEAPNGRVPKEADWFESVASKATRNADSDKLVLGHFSPDSISYQKVAAHYEATYFKVEDWHAVTEGLTQDEIWRINETFLTQQIRGGKQILFSHNPLKARPGSFFEKEVDFLRELGYTFRQKNSWTWEAVYEAE